MICTEYMARTHQNFFETHLPVLKHYDVGALNWGLVNGRSNTVFPWGSPAETPEPPVWFHDIFRTDGTPFDEREIAFLRQMTANELVSA